MKREYANYQQVSSHLKRGSFIRRVEFLPVVGREVPEGSALVMHRGAADVKAFMPRVGGQAQGRAASGLRPVGAPVRGGPTCRAACVERPQDG